MDESQNSKSAQKYLPIARDAKWGWRRVHWEPDRSLFSPKRKTLIAKNSANLLRTTLKQPGKKHKFSCMWINVLHKLWDINICPRKYEFVKFFTKAAEHLNWPKWCENQLGKCSQKCQPHLSVAKGSRGNFNKCPQTGIFNAFKCFPQNL